MLRPALAVAVAVAAVVAAWQLRAGAETTGAGASDAGALYDRFCLACHGEQGDGRGPAAPWLWPRPRDFTTGQMKWRTTGFGQPATNDDIARAIRYGVPGTSMHDFAATLTDGQIDALVDRVKRFAPNRYATAPQPVELGEPPEVTPELIADGKAKLVTYGCVQCHGEDLRGDTPAAQALRDPAGRPAGPYDLTAQLLRRPRPDRGDALRAIYTSITTGLDGTSMISFAALPDADRWALAAYIDSTRYRGPARNAPTDTDPIAIDLDRAKRLTRTGYWPGAGSADERAVWGEPLAPQGPPPPALAPAQASIDANQCARCHKKQVREWRGSLHAGAASPGLMAQLIRQRARHGFVESCQRCHNPLAEQLPVIRTADGYAPNPSFDDTARHQGVSCAGCHLRNWRRLGPPLAPDSKLLALPGYPRTVVPIYERSDFCLACHQLPPRTALAGKPLLNTYREWLEGPYMKRGIQCQHCHMPNREHTFKGVHDPDTFRQGIKLEAIAGRSKSGTVSVRARLWNVGAGHYLPTTPTPAAWLTVELVDADGEPIRGAAADERIGRHLESGKGGWRELEDTRIPPGENLELAAAWKNGRVGEATHARVTVKVHPDDYYEGFYEARLKQTLTPEVRALFREALRRGRASHYVAEERLVPISSP